MKRVSATALMAAMLIHSPAQAESLPEMLHKLLEEHPQVEAQREIVESSFESQKEAASTFLPRVDITSAHGFESIDRTETNPPANQTNYPTENYTLTVTQNLFDGFRSTSTKKSAAIATGLANSTLGLTEQQILFEAISSYLNVLRQIELTNLSLENQNTLKQQLNLEDERVQRGSGIAVDVLQAKSRLQISKERYTAFMGALKDAVSRYTQVFNEVPNLDTMSLPDMPHHNIPETLEMAIEYAVKENPSLEASKKSVDLASEARTSAKSAYFPTVDIVGTSAFDDNASGTSGHETKYSVALKTSWSIFNGFADRARIKRSQHDYQAALSTDTFTERKIVEEVKLAWSSLKTSQERLALLKNAVNIAGEVHDARKRLRDAGSETALNVLDAENELFRAKIDAASAEYDYYTSLYRLLLSMGQLTVNNVVKQAGSETEDIPHVQPEDALTPEPQTL